MTQPRTPALIRAQDKYAARMKADGMVQVTVWVPAARRGEIYAAVEGMRQAQREMAGKREDK